jgi:hypothetical protein
MDFKNDTKGIKKFVVESITQKYNEKRQSSIEVCNKINSLQKKSGY